MKQATDTYGSVDNRTVIFADKIYLYINRAIYASTADLENISRSSVRIQWYCAVIASLEYMLKSTGRDDKGQIFKEPPRTAVT